ncbi:non-ribosomal peptide synthetase [Nocardiopsis ansamitocini]|uniref:Phenyloxazoline synthase MbtB n=1 Tax=Nocardiopsis ansamitocini TaxID=1670832 RepID=A0A9W6PAX2_9ACTN|nr:non-ribosomal peptide synthetase [Nocardiopsis ansamitocini]GLU50203.1 non-ribosomal peptide synthetase [Nocardiopsis ansamitocini]
MMDIRTLLTELDRAGVHLWTQDGELRFRAPKGALTDTHRAAVRDHRAEVIAHLEATAPALTPAPEARHEPFPLTEVQAAYLIGRGNAYDHGGLDCHAYLELDVADLDPARLSTAWAALVDRHDMLRVTVSEDGFQQVLDHPVGESFTVTETGDPDASVRQARARLSDGRPAGEERPLVRLHLTRSRRRSVLHLSVNLIAADYASVQLLLAELAAFYADPAYAPAPLALSFRDYVLARRALKDGPLYQRDRAYWSERLADLPAAPELPTVDGTTAEPAFTRHAAVLRTDQWAGLRERAERHGLTPSAVALAAYADTIARWSRRPSFTLALPVDQRLDLHPDVHRLVGDFTAVTLLAVEDHGALPFAERAALLHARLLDDLDHGLFTGGEVLAEHTRRRGTPGALMPVVFTSTLGARSAPEADSWAAREVHGISQTPQVWIDCQVKEIATGLAVNWDVRDGVLPEGLAADAFGAYTDLLARLAEDDGAWTEDAPLRLPGHQADSRADANATGAPCPPALLHEAVVAAALATPGEPAVITAGEVLTHGELLAAAIATAARLSSTGCAPGSRVAILMDKGPEQVVAAHAVLLAGCAYVPVDVNQPTARRDVILADAAVTHVLTQSWLVEAVDTERHTPVCVDEIDPAPGPLAPPKSQAAPDDLAYVIYTSGSTGTPKGVMVAHAAALNTVADVNERFGVGPDDRVLALANLGFDLSVYDLFGPLAAGGAIVLPDAERRGDPSHWAELATRHRVTLWNSVPAQLQMLGDYLASGTDEDLSALRLALVSGDWIPVTLPDTLRSAVPGLELVSLGGATEAAIWSIHHRIGVVDPDWPSIPYGRPLAGQTFHVLDPALRDRPDWVAGELYIGGAGLAQGYLGDPERTAERFITRPATGERLYRTGDLGRYRPGGDIEFLGREDSQVKIRGYRIELAEIESAVQNHPGVATAAVVAVGPRDARRLAAFAEPARSTTPPPAPDGLAEAATAAHRAATADLDRDDLDVFLTALDEVALGAVTRTLTTAGLFGAPDTAHSFEEVAAALDAQRTHHRLLRRWLVALVREGRLACDDEGAFRGLSAVTAEQQKAAWQRATEAERRVNYGTELLEYMRTCADRLPELVSGSLDVRSLLFPGADLETAGAAYRDNLAIRHLNAAAAAALARIAGQHVGEERLRVMELGAGVGGTTAALVPALAEYGVDYLFTDVSPFFLTEAREQFADFPWVRYGLFDVNLPVRDQGHLPSTVDVVVAANVLHNAVDAAAALEAARELLVPGGHLLFIETTKEGQYPLMVSMEFLEGLAGGHRDLRADADQTFATRDQWRTLLAGAGAEEPLVLPAEDDRLVGAGQSLFLTRLATDRVPVSTGELTRHVAARLPDYMVPGQWQLLDALPLTANGKVDRAALERLLPREAEGARVATVSAEPADDLERGLVGLWQELLEREHVGRDDDFFALGGDSLLVARMVGRLGEHVEAAGDIEWEVVLRHMLRTPTVAGLAAYLRGLDGRTDAAQERAAATPYVRLNGSGGPVTAIVHAGTGTLVPYRSLITEIRRRSGGASTLAGLELPRTGEFLDADPSVIIKKWAADYARALLDTGGSRFHVVGYCLGGLIATEVARTLGEAGAEVASLTAISTHRPPFRLDDELISEYAFAVMMGIDPARVGFPADENRVSAASDVLLEQTPGLLPDGAIGRLRGEYADVAECFRELAALPRDVRVRRMTAAVPASAGTYEPEALMNLFRIFRQSVFAISRYEPEPYAGDVTFLRHSGAYPFPGNKESVTDYWERLVLGTLTVTEIPGDHFSCLSVPYAPGIVKLLAEITDGDVIA